MRWLFQFWRMYLFLFNVYKFCLHVGTCALWELYPGAPGTGEAAWLWAAMQMLRNKPRSPGRVVWAFNSWAISPDPIHVVNLESWKKIKNQSDFFPRASGLEVSPTDTWVRDSGDVKFTANSWLGAMRNPCSFIPCPNSSLYSSNSELAYPGWIHTVAGAFEKLALLGCALGGVSACMIWALVLLFFFRVCVVYSCICVCVCARLRVCARVTHMHMHGEVRSWCWVSFCIAYLIVLKWYLSLNLELTDTAKLAISELQGSPCVCLLSAMIIEACHHAWQFMCLLGFWTQGTVLLNKLFPSRIIPSSLTC